jgi:hypothetical protein
MLQRKGIPIQDKDGKLHSNGIQGKSGKMHSNGTLDDSAKEHSNLYMTRMKGCTEMEYTYIPKHSSLFCLTHNTDVVLQRLTIFFPCRPYFVKHSSYRKIFYVIIAYLNWKRFVPWPVAR